jgi:hypothetical protein
MNLGIRYFFEIFRLILKEYNGNYENMEDDDKSYNAGRIIGM